ncbi:MAG: RNA polymerase sigma factor [Saprospiraceae bacterium]
MKIENYQVMRINQLVQKHQQYLIQKANQIATNQIEAEDLVQDAILRIIEQQDKFDATRSFKAWSVQLMRNLYINQYNRRKRYRVYAKLPEEMTPFLSESQNEGEENLYIEFLQQSIKKLKKPHRKAFQLFFEGYNQKEIAARFKLPVGTVKYHIFMAKKELQRIIKNDFKLAA